MGTNSAVARCFCGMNRDICTLVINERNEFLFHGSTSYTDENHALCTTYAYDVCGKDYAACYDGADDVCSYTDTTVCFGPGVEDNT